MYKMAETNTINLIFGLTCVLLAVQICSSDLMSIDRWNYLYGRLFGPEQVTMDDRKIVESLVILDMTASTGRFDNERVRRVKFWSNAMINVDMNQCNQARWDELDWYFEHMKRTINGTNLLQVARKSLVDLCSERFLGLGQLIEQEVRGMLEKIKSIYSMFEYYYYQHISQQELWHYISVARRVAGVSSFGSKGKFESAWPNGFCKKILKKLDEPALRRYKDFTNLVTLNAGSYYFGYCSEPTRFAIKLIDMCQHLDCVVRDYLHKGSCQVTINKYSRYR